MKKQKQDATATLALNKTPDKALGKVLNTNLGTEPQNAEAALQLAYTAKAVYENAVLVDLLVEKNGKTITMLGSAGLARELSVLPRWAYESESSVNLDSPAKSEGTLEQKSFDPAKQLAVFIGSGIGAALTAFIDKWAEYSKNHASAELHIAVVDKESALRALTKLEENTSLQKAKIYWIDTPDKNEALKQLTLWQAQHNNLALYPIAIPFYTRLDREYYGAINDASKASLKADFWGQINYTKFTATPRVMLLMSKYFLTGEIVAACERLGLEYRLVQVAEGENSSDNFIQKLLSEIIEFKPDFVFTINHLGVDREGVLIDLLKRLSLPLCSWFVDNPHLVLSCFDKVVSPETVLLTWDSDNLAAMRKLGFKEVHYLPLGVDVKRFVPPTAPLASKHPFRARVSFVGNSMVHKVTAARQRFNDNSTLKNSQLLFGNYQGIAADFAQHDERSVAHFLSAYYPDAYNQLLQSENSGEDLLNYEVFLTWESTRQYRLSCVEAILPFKPLFVGDDGWFELFKNTEYAWNYHSELMYYSDLPVFYPYSEVNFNCTSKQMKGAVNQRVFDVPATGSFILTDWREQLGNLFEPNREIICYHSPEEARDLLSYYLDKPQARNKIAQAARKRILAEHSYDHRLTQIVTLMKSLA